MKKNKVAIYIRVSTKKQVEEGYSLDAQRERLEKMCETNGYIIYKVYADEGKSGKDTNRPAFQEMMKDMREGKFDKILVMKLDRISRSVIDLEIMIKEMQEYNVHFESASEKIDTSSSFGMMFVRLLAIFAQFERERISERVSDAFEEMVSDGRAISGSQPFGYKIDNGKVVIDEDKREIVEYIFDTYEKNNSIRRTLLYTNEKYNLKLRYNTLRLLITNPIFYGCYRGNENYCTGYMTKERWKNIQDIVNKKKMVKVYGSRIYLFSGLVIDVHCGCKMSGHYKKNIHEDTLTYRCPNYRHSKTCESKNVINEKWLENYLLDNLDKYINNYFNSLDKEYTQSKLNYKDNSKLIAEIKAEMKRTTTSFNKGRMEEKDYDREYEKLEKKLAKLQEAPQKKDVSVLKDLSSMDWQGMYKELTQENKQAFWRSFIDKIEIDPSHYKEGEQYIRVYFL
jgi:site-specific DNA recombinase